MADINENIETPPNTNSSNNQTPSKAISTQPLRKEGTLIFAKRALSIMLEHPIYIVCAVVAMALIDALLLRGTLKFYDVQGSLLQQNSKMVSVILTFMGANLLKVILIGPIISMLVVFLGYSFTQNKEISPYKALNFFLRNYKRLFVPFLIAQLCIQIGMVVVIPGVLFMMQYAFVDPVACIEKNSNPLSRSRSMTRGLRKSLLGFIFPWAVFSQISGLVTLQFSDNFLSLISLNIFTQTLYFFILCGFFCAYEYRSYQIATRRAQKEESPLPHRPLTNKKTSPALGWFAFIAIFAGCGFLISQSLQKKNYASCISKTVQDSFNASTPTSSSFNVKSICESAKNTCVATSEPPCAVSCNLTKYNVVHPKDKSKPFTIQGFPNITECMQ